MLHHVLELSRTKILGVLTHWNVQLKLIYYLWYTQNKTTCVGRFLFPNYFLTIHQVLYFSLGCMTVSYRLSLSSVSVRHTCRKMSNNFPTTTFNVKQFHTIDHSPLWKLNTRARLCIETSTVQHDVCRCHPIESHVKSFSIGDVYYELYIGLLLVVQLYSFQKEII